MAIVDDTKVKVGDCLGYKADYEVYGTITMINGSQITIEVASESDEPQYYTDSQNRFWID